MEKNYYEILQVDKNASIEIIDKAYKTLVKKYHPDLNNSNTENNEEQMKKLNEAYEVISDNEKRKNYDETLRESISSQDSLEFLMQENLALKKDFEFLKHKMSLLQEENDLLKNNLVNSSRNTAYDTAINDAVNQAYQDAYVDDMKNRGYKIKYKRTLPYYLKLPFVLLAILIFLTVLLNIKDFLVNAYNENEFFQTLVNTFKNIIN